MKRRIGVRKHNGERGNPNALMRNSTGFLAELFVGKLCWTLALPLLAACSLLVVPKTKQCENTADCQTRGDDFADSICVSNVCTYQCSTTNDCIARGAESWNTRCKEHLCTPSEEWGCVLPDQPPPEGQITTKTYNLSLQVADMLSQVPVPDVTAQLCLIRDLACASPVGKAVVSDAKGRLALKVPGAFDGYVQLVAEDRVPGLYFPPTVTEDRDDPPIALAKAEDLAPFGAIFGGFKPDRGTVMVSVADCAGMPAEGVSFESASADKVAATWYSENNLPIGTVATDQTGFGGFFNMPAGVATIWVVSKETKHLIGSIGLFVNPGALSYGRFVPTAP
jgi:hypothetical protein